MAQKYMSLIFTPGKESFPSPGLTSGPGQQNGFVVPTVPTINASMQKYDHILQKYARKRILLGTRSYYIGAPTRNKKLLGAPRNAFLHKRRHR